MLLLKKLLFWEVPIVLRIESKNQNLNKCYVSERSSTVRLGVNGSCSSISTKRNVGAPSSLHTILLGSTIGGGTGIGRSFQQKKKNT